MGATGPLFRVFTCLDDTEMHGNTEGMNSEKTGPLPPGRPQIGERRINITLPPDVMTHIDAVRGDETRPTWIRRACREQMKRERANGA